MSNQRFLKKQVAQANLNEKNIEQYLDESLNISKLPFLLATPEKVKINRTSTINHFKTTSAQLNFAVSPIELNISQSNTISIMDMTINLADNAFSNQLYVSPCVNKTNSSINSSSSFESQTILEESYTSDSEKFYTVSGSFFDNDLQANNQIFVCCHGFQATDSTQLDLDVDEKVNIVYSKGDFCLVQSQTSGKRGYVPASILSCLNKPWINNASIEL